MIIEIGTHLLIGIIIIGAFWTVGKIWVAVTQM